MIECNIRKNYMSHRYNFNVGDVVTNQMICEEFNVGNSGGMRKSNKNNCLVLISDHTKDTPYIDKWHGDIFHLTGMGMKGDQSLDGSGYQNHTLYYSNENGVELHLFEVLKPKEYTYRGIVKLVNDPYQDYQPDITGKLRKVWVFPVKSIVGAPMISIEELTAQKNKNEVSVSKLSLEDLKSKAILYTSDNPGTQKVCSTEYIRNHYISEYAKRIANGVCQLCGLPAPFKDSNQKDYLETHHIHWLSKGGSDSIENVVALCPNCHRKMHIVNDPVDIKTLTNKAIDNAKKC